MTSFGTRRAQWIRIPEPGAKPPLAASELAAFEAFDLFYRSLCALLYNYVPMSGHPGGSISSGRFVAALLFDAAELRPRAARAARTPTSSPTPPATRRWASTRCGRCATRWRASRRPELLPADVKDRLRLEDLLGFRRNPITATPLFREAPREGARRPPDAGDAVRAALDGRLGRGPGDVARPRARRARHLRAERPARAHRRGRGRPDARAASPRRSPRRRTASLDNVVVHVDWNQASIDSNRVCRDGDAPGDYVQWNPMELFYLHDWNVVEVRGRPRLPADRWPRSGSRSAIDNGQPTAIVYRTVKGWQYGIEGRASHGAGHKLCSDGFYQRARRARRRGSRVRAAVAARPPATAAGRAATARRDRSSASGTRCCWSRGAVEADPRIDAARWPRGCARRAAAARRPRPRARARGRRASRRSTSAARAMRDAVPAELALEARRRDDAARRARPARSAHCNKAARRRAPGRRGRPARLDERQRRSAAGFGDGFWNASRQSRRRARSRLGGICEDAMAGHPVRHRRPSATTSASAPRTARSSRRSATSRRGCTRSAARRAGAVTATRAARWSLVCAHAGLKTGEDGPTHADPQPLQLLQENFPPGTAITLTPWDPQEIWPLLAAALRRRPALIAPFVTRPDETRARPRGARPRAGRGRGHRASTCCARRARRRRRRRRAAGERRHLRVRRARRCRCSRRTASTSTSTTSRARSCSTCCRRPSRHASSPRRARTSAMGITGFTLPTHVPLGPLRPRPRALAAPVPQGHFLGSGTGDDGARRGGPRRREPGEGDRRVRRRARVDARLNAASGAATRAASERPKALKR